MTHKGHGAGSPARERERWATRMGLILAMAGNAIGLGNFLRFPVQCAQNGGGVFLIPYFTALILMGIPLMWVEWAMGRYGGQFGHSTTPGMFHRLWANPIAKYLGALGIFIPFCVTVYYLYIESWTLAYSFFSMSGSYFGISEFGEMSAFLSGFQGKMSNHYFPSIAPAYFFFLVTLAVNIWILLGGVSRGIERLANIALPLIYLFGIILLIRVITLGAPDPLHPEQNAASGFAFMWRPDYSRLSDVKVWLAATGQIFFTLSLGFGAIQTYASYLSKKDDLVAGGLTTACMNEVAEVGLGGSIAIPATVAFFGLAQTAQIASGGSFDLGFFAMPMVFQRLPFGQAFGTFWFLLLFLAGITSSVGLLQPLMAFLQEELKFTRRQAAWVVGLALFFFAQPVILFLKYGFLNEMDFWIGTLGPVSLAAIEVILFMWIFGSRRAWQEIHRGAHFTVPRIFIPVVKYVTPAFLVVLLFIWFSQEGLRVLSMEGVPAENQPYIWFARFLILGILFGVVALIYLASRRGSYSPHHSTRH
ncbi:MAG: sodium-dependent transporter [Candidatus Omnitrophica bacterium]|nr:sodium-dependent transporter [Candidatus Omnitrophota bacterium]